MTNYFIIGFYVACITMTWALWDVDNYEPSGIPLTFATITLLWPVVVVCGVAAIGWWFLKLGWAILRGRVDQ